MKIIHTSSFQATRKLGQALAKKITSGRIICLSGDLGSGKTTFVQGLLQGLEVPGPYTSPTFLIIKQYKNKNSKLKSQISNKLEIINIYHIDAYRVSVKDILDLGWEEILTQSNNLVIIEWAERIKKIIPAGAEWINFSWEGKNKRKIKFS